MTRKTNLLISLLLLCAYICNAQTPPPKQLAAKRTQKPVKIDGLITDDAWKDAAVLDNFIEFRPNVGAKENHDNRTIAYLMYDDEGIYFGGYCYEKSKDSIATEMAGHRDAFGVNDYVGLIFDTYNDKINGFEYFVTPLNEQWDAKMSPGNNDNGGEDFSWNAVWKSGAVIHNDGWSFEMFIPYAAIRFGKKEVQTWGLNITRRRQKTNQQYTWNPIDPTVNGFLTQEGLWTGITNIKPPFRLQFSPYFSAYANHFPANQAGINNWTNQINGGMDVKYGINQAFTLDATLIPDFGQVQSDNRVLNLTPFEVQFNENRTFFTEGTELFSKGNLFYSRRIGGTPIHLYDAYNIGANERIVKNPSESKLINASKISGRTQKGLGIGFLNAITKPQFAIIENINTKQQRKFETDPLTNYNIIVLDKTMKYNSSVSFINTNVMRSGADYDANVSAALFDLNDKKNKWNLGGKFSLSNLIGLPNSGKNISGISESISFGKTSGRFNFSFEHELTDTKYTSNDLGYFTNNNFIDHSLFMGYVWQKPKGIYNRMRLGFFGVSSRLLKRIGQIDNKHQSLAMNINFQLNAKKLWSMGSFTEIEAPEHDFYEPRIEGWFFRRGASAALGTWFETNEAKKYSGRIFLIGRRFFNFYNAFSYRWDISHQYRFNNKLTIEHRITSNPRINNTGFAAIENNGTIVFARRKAITTENILSAKYSFTNKMGITFRARHYVSTVFVKEYYKLGQNGRLTSYPSFATNKNQNLNLFNIDMVYTWQFAPGSFVNIVWKNAVEDFNRDVETSYFKNFDRTVAAPDNNNLSIKVIYFLDYLQLKKQMKKKSA